MTIGEFGRRAGLSIKALRLYEASGLQMARGNGEWVWRALSNPQNLQVSIFADENPRGFGLYQRDRDFGHYQDNEAKYERRPSYCELPIGQWGKGGVELVEIPTDNEFNDNIVAYWVQDAPVKAGKPLSFSYVLSSYLQPEAQPRLAMTESTRLGRVLGSHPQKKLEAMRRVVVDFAGGELEGLARTQPVKAEVQARGGEVDDIIVERLAAKNVWRASFRVLPKGEGAVDLRCRLTLQGRPLTETWLYRWTGS